MILHRPFRHLCPEADLRDAMTDDEFWAHVFREPGPDVDDLFEEIEQVTTQLGPCPMCGESGPCAYDDMGRPMIHIDESGEDEAP